MDVSPSPMLSQNQVDTKAWPDNVKMLRINTTKPAQVQVQESLSDPITATITQRIELRLAEQKKLELVEEHLENMRTMHSAKPDAVRDEIRRRIESIRASYNDMREPLANGTGAAAGGTSAAIR